jgi:hypothetical protein
MIALFAGPPFVGARMIQGAQSTRCDAIRLRHLAFGQGHSRLGFRDPLKQSPIHRPVRAAACFDDGLDVQIEQPQQTQPAPVACITAVAQFAHQLAYLAVPTLPAGAVDLGRVAVTAQAHGVLGTEALGDGAGLTVGEGAKTGNAWSGHDPDA